MHDNDYPSKILHAISSVDVRQRACIYYVATYDCIKIPSLPYASVRRYTRMYTIIRIHTFVHQFTRRALCAPCVHMRTCTRVGERNMEHYLEYEEEFGKCVYISAL